MNSSTNDHAQKKPDSVSTPLAEKEAVPVNDQVLGSADLDLPSTAVPSSTLPTTTNSSTTVEGHVRGADECLETVAEDDTIPFDPKDLYAIMKIDPEAETPLVKK